MKTTFGILAALLLPAAALAAPVAGDPAAPVHQFIDGFNKGDVASAYAAYAPGEIDIIDEFAPHHWHGPKAPRAWAADYDAHAKATGVTDGRVTYGPDTREEVEGDLAYVIMPTVYLYKEHGRAIAEEGQITAVVSKGAGGWKMKAWTWSGVKPHPAK